MEASVLTLPSGGSLSAPLCAALRDLELTDPIGFRGLFDGGESEAERVVRELGGEPGDAAVLVALWVQASAPAMQLERRLSKIPSPSDIADSILFDRESAKQRRKQHIDSVQQALAHSLKPVAPAASAGPQGKWPTRLRRSLALAGDADARETAGRAERDRWIREVKSIVVAAGLPVAHVHSQRSALLGVAQGRRARTLRKRVKDFQKLARYCRSAHGMVWPASVGGVLDFLSSIAEGGAPSSRCIPWCMRSGLWRARAGFLKRGSCHGTPL